MKEVEQVTKDGQVELGYDESLSPREIYVVLSQYFPLAGRHAADPRIMLGVFQGRRFAIRCKNITYLGNPHPYFKKRIQISDDLASFYAAAKQAHAEPLLMGIYSYRGNRVFVEFRIDTYIRKKAHNSSAHVYVSDLVAATVDGYFQKTDYFGNTITAFAPDVVEVFLYQRLIEPQEPRRHGTERLSNTGCVAEFKRDIEPKIRDFFLGEPVKWDGVACYRKMIAAGYRNKFQPEWVGFFLEFEFEQYLDRNALHRLIAYAQDKRDGGVDLDLYFPTIGSYGDLKAHSEESRGVQGNDWQTIFRLLRDGSGHVYYIVCEHSTEKDSAHGYVVTRFWNEAQGKADLMSYARRMKHSAELKRVYILDINYYNRIYLTKFRQGINSNGKPRQPKIMIEQDNLKHFMIARITLGRKDE